MSATAESEARATTLERARSFLPRGSLLPAGDFESRHSAIVAILGLHAVALTLFALVQGFEPIHALFEGLVVGAFAALASNRAFSRRLRAGIASAGLITASAVLVHVSGGYIEAHFHFFIMIGVITLYEDWVPFLLAIAYVALHHGLTGTIAPSVVYNHPGAIAEPWKWAAIHAFFVLGMSAAAIAFWKYAEVSRFRTEAALSQLEATLESTADGILVVDATGRIASYNRKFVDMWRIPDSIMESGDDDQALAYVVDQLKEPEAFVRKVRELYADRHAESFDILHFKDGRVFERISKPQRIAGGGGGRVWSFRDVTATRLAADEARAAAVHAIENERLRELDKFKTQLLNTASHELNTPMTPIKLQLHLLKLSRDGGWSPRAAQAVDVLDRNVERLSLLVRDILDVARLQSGRLPLAKGPMSVRAAITEAQESFGAAAEVANVGLTFEPGEDVVVEADPRRVSQVLFNLLANGLKFTPEGGRVSLRLHASGEEAVVEVEDTGMGLTPEQREKLFQPFSQVHDTMERTRSGTGLGLYISRGIVEQHGGRIWCESDGPGRGTTFAFTLPIRSAPPLERSSIVTPRGNPSR